MFNIHNSVMAVIEELFLYKLHPILLSRPTFLAIFFITKVKCDTAPKYLIS